MIYFAHVDVLSVKHLPVRIVIIVTLDGVDIELFMTIIGLVDIEELLFIF